MNLSPLRENRKSGWRCSKAIHWGKSELVDAPEIIISASELSNCLPEGFKAGDGLDVFV